MARHPDWFERLDAILDALHQADTLSWLGRLDIKAIFAVSERDSIRLLHRFGAEERGNALSLARSTLLIQLEAIRAGTTYAAFARQRQGVAQQLAKARAESAARQFRVRAAAPYPRPTRLEDLPATVAWRRASPTGPARFEIQYDDGADLMWQLAEFLQAAGVNRAEFLEGTEPGDDTP